MIKSSVILVLLVMSSIDGNKLRKRFPRIAGGMQVDIVDFPYQLSLELDTKYICGASVYSTTAAVSAAQCILDPNNNVYNTKRLQIRAGSAVRESGGTLHQASQVKHHSSYNSFTKDFDISVILVSNPFIFSSSIQSITLSKVEVSFPKTGVVSGWGKISEDGTHPYTLRAVSVPFVSRSECNKAYSGEITDKMICAGYEGLNPCELDTGGALIADGVLVGIVSFSKECANREYPAVYTNIANPAITRFITSNA